MKFLGNYVRTLQKNSNPRSVVDLLDRHGTFWVEKEQPKYMNDNEEYALALLADTGYVPGKFERVADEIIMILYVEKQAVTDPKTFKEHCLRFFTIMRERGLRHGDLTEYSVLVHDNKPVVIDWAESRVLSDPRPDKRREGDYHWLMKTADKLCKRK